MGVKKTGTVKLGNATNGAPSSVDIYGQVSFDRDAFTAALRDKGYDVVWEKATYCPNRGGLTARDHKIDCTVCDGSGFLRYAPIATRMLMTSINLNQSYYAYGRWDAGSQMVTALPEMRLHPFDKLTLSNGVARFQELIRRQPNTLRDRPKYKPLCIDHVGWMTRTNVLRVFYENHDFSVNTDGYIVWDTQANRPDDNDIYTISYTYRPVYIVLELMHQHRDSTVDGVHYEFPVQAMAKLDFLVRDESKDAAEDYDQSPFPARS